MNHLQKYELVKQASGGAAGRVLELVTQGGPKGRKLLKELLSKGQAELTRAYWPYKSPESLSKALANRAEGMGENQVIRSLKNLLTRTDNKSRHDKTRIPRVFNQKLTWAPEKNGLGWDGRSHRESVLPGQIRQTMEVSPRFEERMMNQRFHAARSPDLDFLNSAFRNSVLSRAGNKVDSMYRMVQRRIAQKNEATAYSRLLSGQQATARAGATNIDDLISKI
jgi:hypothetical protein